MKLTIVEKNLLSWTAMHIDFVMCKKQHTWKRNEEVKEHYRNPSVRWSLEGYNHSLRFLTKAYCQSITFTNPQEVSK